MSPPRGLSHPALLEQVSWIRALARELVADRELAEDLVQETCAVALENAPRETGRLRQWLAAVLRNALRQHARSQGRRQAREVLGARPEALEPTDRLVERVALQRQLVGAVLELDEPYRSTVLLRFFEELPPREIARRTGVPVATVHSRLQRALARLRERLDGEHGSWALVLLPWIRGLEPAVSPTLVTLLMNTKLSLAVAGAAAAGALVWWNTAHESDPRSAGGPRSVDAAPPASASRAAGSESEAEAAPAEAAPEKREPLERAPARAAPASAAPAAQPAAWTVELRVLDAEAQPLPGIAVRAEGGEEVLGTSGRGGWCVFETRADHLALSAADPSWVAIHEGSAQRTSTYDPVLVLAPAVDLAGFVVDEQGRTLSGARVRFQLPRGFDARFSEVLEATRPRDWIASSGADGRFELSGVPAVQGALVRAVLAGYEYDELEAPLASRSDLELELFRPRMPLAGVLRGTVVDQLNAFVPGARVGLGLVSVLADERGDFEIDLARAVTAQTLSAVKAGFRPAFLERPGEPGPDTSGWPEHVTLTLGGRALSIRGVVRDHEQKPVAGARVWLHDPTPGAPIGMMPTHLEPLMAGAPVPDAAIESETHLPEADSDHFWDSVSRDSGPPSAFWHWVESDAAGVFELPGLDDRRYRLDVLAPESLLLETTASIRAGTRDAVVELPAPDVFPELSGRTVSEGGQPLAGVRVQLFRPVIDVSARVFGGTSQVIKIRSGGTAESDADGRFTFTDVPRRGARLSLASDEIVPASVDVTSAELEIPLEQRCHLEVELRVPTDRYDEMSVADEQGRGLDILFLTEGSVTALTDVPLVDGRSGIVSVSSRARELRLYKDGALMETVPLALVAGQVNRVEH